MASTLINKPGNPAKEYLRRYIACQIRAESIARVIRKSMEDATDIAVHLKPDVTQGGGAYDRVAEDVCAAVDAEETLRNALRDAERVLAEVMEAISAVPDEMQKTVLVLRYVEGLEWMEIAERIHYEISNTYILHGRALWAVNKWMEAERCK